MSDLDSYPVPATPEGQNMLLAMLGRDIRMLTSEVRTLSSTMATKAELESLKTDLHKRIDALAAEVNAKSASSAFSQFLTLGTKVLSFVVVLVTVLGMAVAVVHYFADIKPDRPEARAKP